MTPRSFSFGSYELLARLPSGAPTQTFLARQRGADSFKKLVCLRTLLPAHALDESVVSRFLSEARLAAHLSHPSCTTIYDLGRERGVYYISMEYVSGETLSSLIDASTALDDALPPPLVASILATICDGLHYAHEMRDPQGRSMPLIHGDISPRNIIITYEGHPKLLDFGVAGAKTDHRGKIRYVPPEHQPGRPRDRKTDIYALGLVMFEALAARALGRANAEDRTDFIIGASRPPRLGTLVRDIHPDLEAICDRALAPQPSMRFASVEEVGETLRAYLNDVGFHDRRTSICDLMEDRFGDKSAMRARALEKLLRGDCGEAELEAALGARSIAELEHFFDPVAETPNEKTVLEADTTEEPAAIPVEYVRGTQVVDDQNILDERTDEVDVMPSGLERSTDLWGERTEHDDVKPFEPISDAGAIVGQFSKSIAEGIPLASLGLPNTTSEDFELEDHPTLPRMSIDEEITTAESDPRRAFSMPRDSQFPPRAAPPDMPTSERMMPKLALPLIVEAPLANIPREPIDMSHSGPMDGSFSDARDESFADSRDGSFGGPMDGSFGDDVLPSVDYSKFSKANGEDEELAAEVEAIATPHLPGALEGPPVPESAIDPEQARFDPLGTRKFDPGPGYVTRSAAIKLMIAGVSLGLVLGMLIAIYVFTRVR